MLLPRMSPNTRPWPRRTAVMPASHATAVILPAPERRSIVVMTIWIGTSALPMISGTSEPQSSPITSPSVADRTVATGRRAPHVPVRR